MLSIEGKPGILCYGPSRRELLTVGSVALAGLSLPDYLRHRARSAEDRRRGGGFGRAQGRIFLSRRAPPSHIDLWDPKPNAPDDVRGEFRPIATTAPGMFL